MSRYLFNAHTQTLDFLIPLLNPCKYSLLYVINEFCRAAFSAYLTFVFLATLTGSRVFSVRRFDEGCAELTC